MITYLIKLFCESWLQVRWEDEGKYTVFARVICALFFFPILAAEKSGCVKYADFFFFCGGLDLGFIIV